MSGIEVAGLVLGAIPLLISGLEHYAEGVRTIKSMLRYKLEFASLSRRIRVEEGIYRNAIELLLHDCVDDETLSKLVDDRESKYWSDPSIASDLHDGLRRKLRQSYSVFLETVVNMERTLTEFISRLQLGPDGRGPFNDSRSFGDFYKRCKFALKRSAYMDLVEEIGADNAALTKLTEQSSALEPIRTKRGRVPNFDRIRTQAVSMFNTLQRSLSGSCTALHRASLCVTDCSPKQSRSSILGDTAFRVVLHHGSPPCAQTATPAQHLPVIMPWADEETEFRFLSNEDDAGGSPNVAAKLAQVSINAGPAVRFSTHTKAASSVGSSHANSLSNMLLIQDLCTSLATLRSTKCGVCVGYLEDATTKDRHGLYYPMQPLFDRSHIATVPIEQLLGNELTVLSSRRIALAAATAMLQLYETPWLPKQFGRHEIMMFKKDGVLLAEYPFVSTALGAVTGRPSKAAYFLEGPLIRNATLFGLGILLIELCLAKSFEDLIATSELNQDGTKHAATDLMTANRCLDRVYDTNGKRYGDAVRRCIRCDFDQREATLADAQFRKAVYTGVIMPLQEDVQYFLGNL